VCLGIFALGISPIGYSDQSPPSGEAGTEAPATDEAAQSEIPPPPAEDAVSATHEGSDASPEMNASSPPEETANQNSEEKNEEAKSSDDGKDPLYTDGTGYTDLSESIAKYHEYEQHLPNFGLSLAGSNEALGAEQPLGTTSGTAMGFSAEFEYQPAFLQAIGVIGFGLSGNIYPVGPTASGANNVTGLGVWSAGGQVRYQAKWFVSQPVVPMVAWQAEQLFYKRNDNASGNFTISGPAAGLWILMNIFEPSSAGALYVDTGISRSYLVAEWRSRTGQDDLLTINGGSWYLGLRLEF